MSFWQSSDRSRDGRPALSVVIPVYHESRTINGCLGYLSRCPDASRVEVVVVDGAGGDTVAAIDPRYKVHAQNAPPGRGGQLNRGAESASAPVLVFLHVDTRPPRAFVRMITGSGAEAGAFDLHIRTTSFVVHLISLVGMVRSRVTRIPYGDQVQFINAELFRRIGGFPEIPIMEDVALMDSLKTRGIPIVLLRPAAHTSDRRWQKEGRIRTTLRNWRLMYEYRHGVSPAELAGRYRPHVE